MAEMTERETQALDQLIRFADTETANAAASEVRAIRRIMRWPAATVETHMKYLEKEQPE